MPTARNEPSASDRIQAGFDILLTTVATTTKKVLAQIGSVVGKTVDSENAEWMQHVGFMSRPSKAAAGKQAAQAVVLRLGDRDIVIASQDLRGIELAGQLAEGETALYAAGVDGKAQGRIIIKGDGSVNLLTKRGNTTDGAGVGVFIGADGAITALGADGAGVLLGADASIKVFNKSGAIQITSSGGIKIASKEKVDISAPAVTIGGPSALPIAIAPAVLTAIAALQTEIAAVAGALVAVTQIPGPIVVATHGAAAGAGTTAVGTAVAALAAAVVKIPSQRTSSD